MKVAAKLDMEKYPSLAIISQRKLLQLASLSGDGSLAENLEANGVHCNFSTDDQGKVIEFEGKVDKLIKTLRKETKDRKKPTDPIKLLSKSVTNLEQRVDEISSAGIHNQLKESDLEKIASQLSIILQNIKEINQISD
jgi:hypothetical protein